MYRGLRDFGDLKAQFNTSCLIRNNISWLAKEAATCFDPKG
jgi:hypothetical protein